MSDQYGKGDRSPDCVRDEALALLAELADPDWHGECWYDHHGYCQAHGYLATEPPCPYARARALLRSQSGPTP